MFSKTSQLALKTDTQAVFLLTLLVGIVILRMRPFDKGCLPVHDCNAYIQMVDSLQPQAGIHSHHAMRILPSWAVSYLHVWGLSIHSAFLLLSGAAFWLTGFLSYQLFRTHSANRAWCLLGSMALLMPHWAMWIPLKTPYQASDAWVYVWTLLTIWAVERNAIVALFAVSVLGILTRQNCFVLAFFAYFYLWTQIALKQQWRVFRSLKAWILVGNGMVLTALYGFLSHYYHAEGSLLRHMTPTTSFWEAKFWAFFIKDSHFFELWIMLIPWLILIRGRIVSLCTQQWHWVAYASIVILQPIFAYSFTGYHNFVRIALQGVWILYFLSIREATRMR